MEKTLAVRVDRRTFLQGLGAAAAVAGPVGGAAAAAVTIPAEGQTISRVAVSYDDQADSPSIGGVVVWVRDIGDDDLSDPPADPRVVVWGRARAAGGAVSAWAQAADGKAKAPR